MSVDLDELANSIVGSYDLCHVRASDVLDVIHELENARTTLAIDAQYIAQCHKHLPKMTPKEFWEKD